MNSAIIEIRLKIQDTDKNYFVFIPNKGKKIEEWRERMEESIKHWEGIEMKVDSLTHGCDGIGIYFLPYHDNKGYDEMEKGTGFGFVVDKKKLTEMIEVLQTAKQYYF